MQRQQAGIDLFLFLQRVVNMKMYFQAFPPLGSSLGIFSRLSSHPQILIADGKNYFFRTISVCVCVCVFFLYPPVDGEK